MKEIQFGGGRGWRHHQLGVELPVQSLEAITGTVYARWGDNGVIGNFFSSGRHYGHCVCPLGGIMG